MKKKTIIRLILVLILIILFIKIYFLKGLSNLQKIDDLLFIKLLSNGVSSPNKTQNPEDYSNENRI